MINGFIFKKPDSNIPWPVYSDEDFNISNLQRYSTSRLLKVVDELTSTTKIYPSAASFAREFGIKESSVHRQIMTSQTRPILNRYRASFMD